MFQFASAEHEPARVRFKPGKVNRVDKETD